MKNILDRFEEKYIRAESGCHLWIASKNPAGYGHFSVDCEVKDAHRISYELYVGQIPKGMFVLHRCDNTSCVNPEHLFLGTQADNLDDMDMKGRRNTPHGETHYCAKLTLKQVESIRVDDRTHRAIAKHYGVGKTIIGAIKRGEKWK